MKTNARRIPDLIEIVFDILYLCTGTVLGIVLLTTSDSPQRTLYGMMALLLVFGDAFHLLPRIGAAYSGDRARYLRALGAGKLVTSVTMTVFYLLLWQIGLICFPAAGMSAYTPLVYLLAAVRVALCLFPQNRWLHGDGPQSWNIWRNIPFALLGLMVMALYYIGAAPGDSLRMMPLAVFLSFAFYLPVVLGSAKYPMLGMLMIPKTCVYIWIICMGLTI